MNNSNSNQIEEAKKKGKDKFRTHIQIHIPDIFGDHIGNVFSFIYIP